MGKESEVSAFDEPVERKGNTYWKMLRPIFNVLTPLYHLPCLKRRRWNSFNMLQLIESQFAIGANFNHHTVYDQHLLQRCPCPLPLEYFIEGEPVTLPQTFTASRTQYEDDPLHSVALVAGRQYVGDPLERRG